MALQLRLQCALGLSDKTTDAVRQAISGATPEQMLALKQADQEFALQMQALGFKQVTDLEALAAGDRKDARAMQIAQRSWVPAALSIIVTIGYFGYDARLAEGVSLTGFTAHAWQSIYRLGCSHCLLVRRHL